MKKIGKLVFVGLLFFGFGSANGATGPESEALSAGIKQSYERINYPEKPGYELYRKAVIGYLNLRSKGALKKELLVIADFSVSSNQKRLWVINMENHEVVYHNLVAHGRNSGNEFARKFSNIPNSNMSSLGFYVTAEKYVGKHGLSLRLDGQEKGFNHNARKRAIVMHGANYVDQEFGRKYGRIGRSFGCPSVPMEGHQELFRKIADGACLFIYSPDEHYLANTLLQDELQAFKALSALKT